MYLIADVGGTKTNVAIFSDPGEPLNWEHETTYNSQRYGSLEEILQLFLDAHPIRVDAACLCVAGPVLKGKANITNLPWRIEEGNLGRVLGTPQVRVINDLVATALAIPHLEEHDLEKMNAGVAVEYDPIAVLAPGTGLGQAYLTWDGRRYRAHASEGGHVDFAPTNALQWGLLQWLQEKYGHVSVERVCSGLGITNVYQYLKMTGYAEEPTWLARMLADVRDATPVIVGAALEGETCELCRTAVNTFVEILGEQAGNLALTLLARGGLYLGGGIPPRILPLLKSEKFYYAYKNKGRFEQILDRIPIHVILNAKAALVGAAYEALAVATGSDLTG